MKQIILSGNKKGSNLKGKSVVTLFYENSTRTRVSFELASKYLGAASSNISASSSSVSKGETLIDTGKTLDMMGVDVIVMRHNMAGAPHLLSKYVNASVINAGDGMNEHPTQALLDLYTVLEKKGKLDGLKVAIIGDIYHSRVVRSNILGFSKLGADVFVSGPGTLMPVGIEKMGCTITKNVDKAIKGADVVMGLRIQMERQKKALLPSVREYVKYFGINSERMKLAKESALIMHPGPVNRGVEMPSCVVDSENSVINEQVLNGVAVRMAILDSMVKSKKGA